MKKYHPLDIRNKADVTTSRKLWLSIAGREPPWAAPGPVQAPSDRKARERYRRQVEREELAKRPWYFALLPTLDLMAQVRAA